jgi:hypothetical protein
MSTNQSRKVILCEINHFYCKHPGVISFAKELSNRYNADLVAYQPYADWNLQKTLPHVVQKFVASGFKYLVSPNPSSENKGDAISFVKQNLEKFLKFSIADPVKEFRFQDVPVGNLLTEVLPQYFDTFDLENDQVLAGVSQALSRIAFWNDLFNKYDVQTVIFSHAVYDFGFPVFAARIRGIPAYSVNENHIYRFDYRLESLLDDNKFNRWDVYFETFLSDEKELLRHKAKLQLHQRLFDNAQNGLLATDTRAYRENGAVDTYPLTTLPDTGRNKVVLFTHALSDAPYSSQLLDADFLTPLRALHTIFEITKNLDFDFYVKDHPNPFPRDRLQLLKIVKNYPHVKTLPSDLTLRDLKKGGCDLIITGWGTVIIEAAYLEVPVVAYSSLSPAEQFSIAHVATGKRQLTEFLSDPSRWTIREAPERAIDAFAATDLIRSVDWCGIDFDKLTSELGVNGGYTPNFYLYWDKYESHEKALTISRRIRRYLDSREQWFTVAHL